MRPQRLHLSKKQSRWLPPAQLRDGAVIRHLVEGVEAQVPTQGDVGLDTPLDLPLRRDAVQEPHLQVLHDDHRVDGRTAVFFAVKRGCCETLSTTPYCIDFSGRIPSNK